MKQTCDYGYVRTPFGSPIPFQFASSAKGSHWGTNISLGALFKAGATIMEPYVAGGFERVNLSGDGVYYANGVLNGIYPDTDLKKHIWSIGGGLALRF